MYFGGTNLLRLEKQRARLGMRPPEMMSSPIGLPPNRLPHTKSLHSGVIMAGGGYLYVYENLKVLFIPCAFRLTCGWLRLSDILKCMYIPVQNILLCVQ